MKNPIYGPSHLSIFKLILFLVFISVQIYAQPDLYIFGMGGLNYIPMQNFSHHINGLPNFKSDKIGFNGVIGLKYKPEGSRNIFLVSSEIINKNASFAAAFVDGVWNFKVIPIAFGYQYLFAENGSNIRPFAGCNISYSFIEIEEEFVSDVGGWETIYKDNKFAIEPNFGVSIKLADSFFIISEIKYRYMSDVEYTGWTDVNFSGLILNAGIQIEVL